MDTSHWPHRHPSHHQSATDQDDTVIFNRLLLTQVPLESKGQSTKRTVDDGFSARSTPSLLLCHDLTDLLALVRVELAIDETLYPLLAQRESFLETKHVLKSFLIVY